MKKMYHIVSQDQMKVINKYNLKVNINNKIINNLLIIKSIDYHLNISKINQIQSEVILINKTTPIQIKSSFNKVIALMGIILKK